MGRRVELRIRHRVEEGEKLLAAPPNQKRRTVTSHEHLLIEVTPVVQRCQRIVLTLEQQPCVGFADTTERPRQGGARQSDDPRGNQNGLLLQLLRMQVVVLERVVPFEQLDLARAALRIEFARKLQ